MILLPPPLSLLKRFPFCSSLERPALRALRSLPRPRRDPAHAAIKARGIRCRFPSLRRQSRAAGGAALRERPLQAELGPCHERAAPAEGSAGRACRAPLDRAGNQGKALLSRRVPGTARGLQRAGGRARAPQERLPSLSPGARHCEGTAGNGADEAAKGRVLLWRSGGVY